MVIENQKQFREAFINACDDIDENTCLEILAVNPQSHDDYLPALGYVFHVQETDEIAFVGAINGFDSIKDNVKNIASYVAYNFAVWNALEKIPNNRVTEVDFFVDDKENFEDTLYSEEIGFPELNPNLKGAK